MYQNKIIKEIYEKTNLVSLVSEKTLLKKDGKYLYGLCPFHAERKPSFAVDPEKQTFHCYGCGAGGNAYSFVMQSDKCTFEESVTKLAKRAGIPVPKNTNDEDLTKKKNRFYQIYEYAFDFYRQKGSTDAKTKKYLMENRGLSEETIKKFGLGKSGAFGQELYRHLMAKGFTNEEMLESGLIGFGEVFDGNDKKKKNYYDSFWNRVLFPIFNKDNKVVGFGGRIFGDGKPKYLNSPESLIFDKSHELYGLSFAKTQKKSFILCEGFFDVISMHQAGFHTAVASLGTSLTIAQSQMIAEYTNTVYIAYDSDEPGVKATTRAIEMLEDAGLRVFVVSTAPFKDVDELLRADDSNATEMKKRIKAAVPGKTFLVQQLNKKSDSYYERVAELI